jgi:hypothetical protein
MFATYLIKKKKKKKKTANNTRKPNYTGTIEGV